MNIIFFILLLILILLFITGGSGSIDEESTGDVRFTYNVTTDFINPNFDNIWKTRKQLMMAGGKEISLPVQVTTAPTPPTKDIIPLAIAEQPPLMPPSFVPAAMEQPVVPPITLTGPIIQGVTTEPPTMAPTMAPTMEPTMEPTMAPTMAPTMEPTMAPTMEPTMAPTMAPPSEPSMEKSSMGLKLPPMLMDRVATFMEQRASAQTSSPSIMTGPPLVPSQFLMPPEQVMMANSLKPNGVTMAMSSIEPTMSLTSQESNPISGIEPFMFYK